jgi:excisionase family DNA binding protein
MTPALLTYRDLAKILRIHPGTLRAWVARKTVPHTKIGRAVRFTEAQVAEMIRTHEVQPVRVWGGNGR